jgi:hypothetical protein
MKAMKKINLLLASTVFMLLLAPIVGVTGAVMLLGTGILFNSFLPKGVALGIITPGDITWNGKEIRSMSEAIFVDIYTNPELNQLHQIVEDIVALQQIVFLGILSKITKADAGCGTGKSQPAIEMTEKFWEPKKVKIWLYDCEDTLEQSFWVWATNKGINRDDLTRTDFSEFVMERMSSAMLEDVLRIVWFNDTDAAHYSDTSSGIITNSVSLTDYNMIDGLWKQIYAAVANDSTRRVTIAENAQATYANQAFDSTDTTNRTVSGYLQDVIDNADFRLSEAEGKGLQFYVTKSIYNQYKKELKAPASGGVNEAWFMIQDGKKVLTFDGIPVIPISFWDRTIRADFNNGTKYYQPHRIVLTVKENIPIGFDDSGAVNQMKVYYDDELETTNWKSKYRIDTKLLQDYLIQVAY